MPSYDPRMGRRHSCSAAFVPFGGGRVERGPIDTRGETDYASQTNRSTYGTLYTLLGVLPSDWRPRPFMLGLSPSALHP